MTKEDFLKTLKNKEVEKLDDNAFFFQKFPLFIGCDDYLSIRLALNSFYETI